MRVGGIGNDPVVVDTSPTSNTDDDGSSSSDRIRDRILDRHDDDPATSGIGSTTDERIRDRISDRRDDDPATSGIGSTRDERQSSTESRTDIIDRVQETYGVDHDDPTTSFSTGGSGFGGAVELEPARVDTPTVDEIVDSHGDELSEQLEGQVADQHDDLFQSDIDITTVDGGFLIEGPGGSERLDASEVVDPPSEDRLRDEAVAFAGRTPGVHTGDVVVESDGSGGVELRVSDERISELEAERVRGRIDARRDDDPSVSGIGSTDEERNGRRDRLRQELAEDAGVDPEFIDVRAEGDELIAQVRAPGLDDADTVRDTVDVARARGQLIDQQHPPPDQPILDLFGDPGQSVRQTQLGFRSIIQDDLTGEEPNFGAWISDRVGVDRSDLSAASQLSAPGIFAAQTAADRVGVDFGIDDIDSRAGAAAPLVRSAPAATRVPPQAAVAAGVFGGAALAANEVIDQETFGTPEIETPERRSPVLGSEVGTPQERTDVAGAEVDAPTERVATRGTEIDAPTQREDFISTEIDAPAEAPETDPSAIETQQLIGRGEGLFEDPLDEDQVGQVDDRDVTVPVWEIGRDELADERAISDLPEQERMRQIREELERRQEAARQSTDQQDVLEPELPTQQEFVEPDAVDDGPTAWQAELFEAPTTGQEGVFGQTVAPAPPRLDDVPLGSEFQEPGVDIAPDSTTLPGFGLDTGVTPATDTFGVQDSLLEARTATIPQQLGLPQLQTGAVEGFASQAQAFQHPSEGVHAQGPGFGLGQPPLTARGRVDGVDDPDSEFDPDDPELEPNTPLFVNPIAGVFDSIDFDDSNTGGLFW